MAQRNETRIPTILLRGVVAFPHMSMHFDISRPKAVAAVEEAMNRDREVFLLTQKELLEESPEQGQVYDIGVIAEIRQIVHSQGNDSVRVLASGLYPAQVRELYNEEKFYTAEIRRLPLSRREHVSEEEMKAVTRSVKAVFERYCQLHPSFPQDLQLLIMCREDPEQLFEDITFNVMLDYHDKQSLLEQPSLYDRLLLLHTFLCQEITVREIERDIHETAQKNIEREQKSYFLREQMRVISNQLREEGEEDFGDEDAYAGDDMDYVGTIRALRLPEDTEKKLLKDARRLLSLPAVSQEADLLLSYLNTVTGLPWNRMSKDVLNLDAARETLNAGHYGLEKVKERILESLAVRMLKPDLKGQVLCLVGPPGVGKSSIAKSIAEAMGRKFVRVSLGGVRDEADIRGHRKTYLGAMPGRIITALQEAQTRNPVILLDELDKMGNDYKGDPASAMLEVLDGDQNGSFRDHYLEVPFDLSQVFFIATANVMDTIPAPLIDRMEIIELASYTREEKFQIGKRHLVAKQRKAHGLEESQCRFEDEALYEMIDSYTKEAGVRQLERTIAQVCRKAAHAIASGKRKRITVRKADIKKYLGIPKYLPDDHTQENTVGLVNGLAWTAVGGVLMPLEALVLEGTGKIEITGSLGDVMKESARLAVSYARSVAKDYDIPPDFYQTKDIHIHAPDGAVPKDGPSAGVSIATALVSALSGIPVRADVAMTGEITLHGKVMPIGGLREKSMAAYKAGIHTVLIPEGNTADLEEVDDVVKSGVKFQTVHHLSQVLDTALARPAKARGEVRAADAART